MLSYKRYILLFTMMNSFYAVYSQTVSSPYSIVGLGDVENRNTGRTAGMASVSASMRSYGRYNPFIKTTGNINPLNPASLTAMPKHAVLFEVAAKGRNVNFKIPGQDTFTTSSSDFAFKRVSLAYKITNKMAFSFGLQPFSTANYEFRSIASLGGSATDQYLRTVTGTGSMQELYFTQALELEKHFSVGYTFSYLFGSLNQNINYNNPFLSLDITKINSNYLRGPRLKLGAQYYSNEDKKLQHRFGVVVSMPVSLSSENSFQVTEGSVVVHDPEVTNNTQFKVPFMLTAGYSVVINHKLTVGADYQLQQWQAQGLPVGQTTLTPSSRFSVGAEFANSLVYNSKYFERYYLQAGLFYENTYWQVKNSIVNDYGITFGAGTNIKNIGIFGALEVGKRGSISLGQISEIYQQLTIGITFKDLWERSPYSKYR